MQFIFLTHATARRSWATRFLRLLSPPARLFVLRRAAGRILLAQQSRSVRYDKRQSIRGSRCARHAFGHQTDLFEHR